MRESDLSDFKCFCRQISQSQVACLPASKIMTSALPSANVIPSRFSIARATVRELVSIVPESLKPEIDFYRKRLLVHAYCLIRFAHVLRSTRKFLTPRGVSIHRYGLQMLTSLWFSTLRSPPRHETSIPINFWSSISMWDLSDGRN